MTFHTDHVTYEWMLGIQPSIWNAGLALFFLMLIKLTITTLHTAFFHPLSQVPGPRLASLTEHYLAPAQIQGRRAQTLHLLHKQYGPVVRIAPNEVSCSDWKVYRALYNGKVARKRDAFYLSASVAGYVSMFSMSNTAMHSARRKLQAQPHSQQAIHENESLIASKAKVMVDRMISESRASTTGKVVDVYTLCGLFSLEVIFQCGFNYDVTTQTQIDSRQYLRAMDQAAHIIPINAVMPFLYQLGIARYIPGFIGVTFRALDRWNAMTRVLVDSFEQNERAYDKTFRFMATPLLTKTDEYLGRKLHRGEVLEESMALAFAGTATTSTTLLYILYSLSRPETVHYQDQLRAELQESRNANAGRLDLHTLQNLPLLNALIKETMRLHPTVISTLPRTLDTEMVVTLGTDDQELVLPRGVHIGMQNYVHHRDPAVFPDPNSFLPERWFREADNQLRDMNSALTPFSLGPQNCIGQNLAKAEILLLTAEVFSRLRLTVNSEMKLEDMEMEDRFSIVPKSRKLMLDVDVV